MDGAAELYECGERLRVASARVSYIISRVWEAERPGVQE